MTTCPFCKQTDIDDAAQKCHHCGSWLDEGKQADEFERFRRDMRTALIGDLERHRSTLDSAFTTMKWVGGIIIVAVAGVSAYFGYRTDTSISEIAGQIRADAQARMELAINEATRDVIRAVDGSIAERMNSEEVLALIDETITSSLTQSVQAEVETRVSQVESEVQEQVDAAAQGFETTLGEMNARVGEVVAETATVLERVAEFKAETERVVSDVAGIQSSFSNARVLQVSDYESELDFQIVDASGKEGLDQLPELVESRINALTFALRGGYWAPIAWKYLDVLNRLNEFQFVVLLDEDGRRALGYWDARSLAAQLNPPDNGALSAAHGQDMFSIPSEDEIPGWVAFAEMLTGGEFERLTEVGAFTGAENAVSADWSNLETLDHMQRIGAETLPVLREDGSLAGIVDRSRLTTRMLIEISGRQN